MPFAEYGCGLGACGLDPLEPSTVERYPDPPALVYDPRIRDWARDEDGNVKGGHPVDEQVRTICFFAQRSLKSNTAHGQGLADIEYIDPDTHQNRVETILLSALKRLIDGKKIAVKITAEHEDVRCFAKVTYKNLVTGVEHPDIEILR